MDSLSLAVISDLHIGRARAKDLWPIQARTPEEQVELDRLPDSDYINKFKQFIINRDFQADYLIIPGDISNTAQHAQFDLASSVILEIAEVLKVSSDKILYVPGNHDLDWQMMNRQDQDPTNFYKELRYIALKDNKLIFEQIMGEIDGHVLTEPWFSVWNYSNLFVIGYNSAWEDTPTASPHHGSIKQDHLLKIDSLLSKQDIASSKLKLFLVHHHPFNYSDPDPDFRDFSAMGNADNLLSLLRKYKFDLVIHGHKHWPRFLIDHTNGIFPIAVLAAGSFSAQIYGGWEGKVNNQFHLIKIGGRNKNNGTIYGKVLSWTYLAAHGWIPSKENNGIEHVSPFGSYFAPEEVKETIQKLVRKAFTTKTHVQWSELVKGADHLKNLNTAFRDHILTELESEKEFMKHPIETDIIFLKLT